METTSKPEYWEDFVPGTVFPSRTLSVSAEEVVSFAQKFDPLPIHLGEHEAAGTPLGIFCASGIHTLAMTQRLFGEVVLLGSRLIAGGSMDNFKVTVPVKPGDSLHSFVKVQNIIPHPRRSDAGWVNFLITTYNQNDQLVLKYDAGVLFERRNAA